jgi:hypothetical protein
MINDMYDDFIVFLNEMSAKSETFDYWYRFVHYDCLHYILLFLAGRSGNWNLRLFALKKNDARISLGKVNLLLQANTSTYS